jgi:DNA-binding GntR family transcriptional regulator
VAGRLEPEELARLQALAEPPVDPDDEDSVESFIAANRAVHLGLVEAAGNARAALIVERLLDDSERARRVALRSGAANRGTRARDELRSVLRAVAAGDGAEAATLMAEAIAAFRDELVAALQQVALDQPIGR